MARVVAMILMVLSSACELRAQFVAYNDQAPGVGTSPNATTWNIRTNHGSVLPLKDVHSGNPLTVSLEIRTNNFNVTGSRVFFPNPSTAGNPSAGTPAYDLFNGFVDFAGSGDSSVELQGASAAVTNIFSGLNPSKTYSLQATAVRAGPPDYSNRWALVTLLGAATFTTAHTTNTITFNQDPSLGANQVAINTGLNTNGAMADFRTIVPAGSTLMLVSMHYSNATLIASNGYRCNGIKGYAITGFRLEEISGDPNSLSITSPTNNSVFAQGEAITISVSSGPGVSSVSYYDGTTLLGADLSTPFSFVYSNAVLGSHSLKAVGAVLSGSVTSAPVIVQVNPNQAPQVGITNLVDNQNFLVGDSTMIHVNAVDPDDGLAHIDFYVNGSLFYRETAPPYFVEVNDMAAGSHSFFAVAVDAGGLSATSAPVSIIVTNVPGVSILISNRSVWSYLDNGIDQGTAWREVGFNDITWQSGPAELGFGDDAKNSSNGTPKPEQTVIAGGPSDARYRTTYFRRKFNVPNPNAVTNLILNLLRDDGGIVYINGQEVFRSNMPELDIVPLGGMAFTNFANAAPSDDGTAYVSTNILQPAFLVQGLNTIAVEIHQNSATSSDLSFDLMLWAQPSGGPTLSAAAHPNDPSAITITWTGSGILQRSTDLSSPNNWQDVNPQPVTPSYEVSISNGQPTFFRLR